MISRPLPASPHSLFKPCLRPHTSPFPPPPPSPLTLSSPLLSPSPPCRRLTQLKVDQVQLAADIAEIKGEVERFIVLGGLKQEECMEARGMGGGEMQRPV